MKAFKNMNAQFIINNLAGFGLIIIMEIISLEQSFGDASVNLSVSLQNLVTRLPSMITSYMAILLYLTATLSNETYKFKKDDVDYKTFEQKISDFSQNRYLPTLFDRYCLYINRQRKIRAYKRMMHNKCAAIENKFKDKDYAEWNKWSRYKKELEKNPETPAMVLNSKLCQKRAKLEDKRTEEYINDNLENIKVKYRPITASQALGGIEGDPKESDEDQSLTSKWEKVAIVTRDRGPGYLYTFAILATIHSFALHEFQIEAHWSVWLLFALRTGSKLIAMIWTIFNTIRYSDVYNQKITMKDIRFRWGLCEEYNQWLKQQTKLEAANVTENN